MIGLYNISYSDIIAGQEIKILNSVNCTIGLNEYVCFYGNEFSGIKTLLQLILAVIQPSFGKYVLDKADVTTLDEDQRSLLRIENFGFILKSSLLSNSLSCYKNVEQILTFLKLDEGVRKDYVVTSLNKLKITYLADKKPPLLTNYEKKLVELARGIVLNPKFLLIDEPTMGIRESEKNEFMSILSRTHDRGQSIILFTEDSKIAKNAKRIIWIDGGQIKKDFVNNSRITYEKEEDDY